MLLVILEIVQRFADSAALAYLRLVVFSAERRMLAHEAVASWAGFAGDRFASAFSGDVFGLSECVKVCECVFWE